MDLKVFSSGTVINLHSSISANAVHAIYAAKLAKNVGYLSSINYMLKRNIPAGLLMLAYMCETSPACVEKKES